MDLAAIKALSLQYLLGPEGGGAPLAGVTALLRSEPGPIEAMVYKPLICLILQGAKNVSIGDHAVALGAGQALIVSHDLPVLSQITKASRQAPYLALVLTLDLSLLRALCDQLPESWARETEGPALSLAPASGAWLDPLARYIALAATPLDAKILGPSVLRELHYRLLCAPFGPLLRRLARADSPAGRIDKAIGLLHSGFRAPLAVPTLAKAAGMSLSSFHDHFKTLTGTTPLQYQKDLRLIAAKTLLRAQGRRVLEAALDVGYESPSQFCRDYRRKFGIPPRQDRSAPL